MTERQLRIFAKEHLDPEGSIVDSGTSVARHVVSSRQHGHQIVVSFVGVRGISSSYFNALFHILKRDIGIEAIGKEITFEFDSALQEDLLQRSVGVMRKNAEPSARTNNA